jgi:hypothetical protein
MRHFCSGDLRGTFEFFQSSNSERMAEASLVFLLTTANDHQSVVGQGTLKFKCFFGWSIHPNVDFIARCQNGGHRFEVDGSDQFVWLGRQKRKNVVCRLAFLYLSDGGPACPDAREESERPRLVEGEPDGRVGAVRLRLVLREAGERHDTAAFNPKPAPPVRGFDIADIGDARIGFLPLESEHRGWHAPARHHQLSALGMIAHDRCRVIREDARHRREISRPVGEAGPLIATCRACGHR